MHTLMLQIKTKLREQACVADTEECSTRESFACPIYVHKPSRVSHLHTLLKCVVG